MGLPAAVHRTATELRAPQAADFSPSAPMVQDVSQGRHLDGLRGLAALIVLFGHCSNANMHVVPGLNLYATAKTGVWLFFVLSAYLLSNSLVRAVSAQPVSRAVPAYAVRRAFRIMPLYYFVLGILWALDVLPSRETLDHFAFIAGRGNFWTIPVEMAFYVLLVPIALLLSVFSTHRLPIAGALVLIGLAAYWATDSEAIYENSFWVGNYLLFFAVGIAVAQLQPSGQDSFTMGLGILGCIAIVISLPPVIAWTTGATISEGLSYVWVIGLAWGVVLFAVTSNSVLRRLMSNRALAFAGKVSFGLYLTHIFVMPRVAEAGWIPAPMKGVVVIVFSVLVATACYYLLERHMIAAGAQLARRFDPSGSHGGSR